MLKRKFHGPREFIFREDAAVASGYDDYIKASYDRSKLTMVDGQTPTVVRIEPLTARVAAVVDTLGQGRTRDLQVFRCGVVAIENWPLEADDGTERPCPPVKREQVGDLGMMISDSWLETVQPPGWMLEAVSFAIWRITEPDPT